MYVRFVIAKRDETSCVPQGIIHAAYDLRDAGQFSRAGEERFQELREWLNENLLIPKRFSRRDSKRRAGPAICWFKDSAREAIRRTRCLAELVEEHGQPAQMLLCRRPGYVVYEDAQQIAAEPFRPELSRIRRRT
jgi:hypothetical protein